MIRNINPRRLRWDRACSVDGIIQKYVQSSSGKIFREVETWVDNIKMDLEELGFRLEQT